MKVKQPKVSDISKNTDEQLLEIRLEDLMPLPYPYDKPDSTPHRPRISGGPAAAITPSGNRPALCLVPE